MKIYAPITAVFVLSACSLPIGNFALDHTSSANVLSLPVVISGNCGASGLQNLMNQPESALSSVALPANTRIIRPGADFERNADRSRLNIGISGEGRIVHVACG